VGTTHSMCAEWPVVTVFTLCMVRGEVACVTLGAAEGQRTQRERGAVKGRDLAAKLGA
jgi:hypothetical protein